MALRVDHIIVSVRDLENAISEFTKKGFAVSPGGSHKGGITHNALIHFQDHTFMELISFTSGMKSMFVRFLCSSGILKYFRWIPRIRSAYRILERMSKENEGMIDLCMVSDSFPNDLNAMMEEGLSMASAVEFHRTLSDGTKISWQMGMPDFHLLPFFRSEYLPVQSVPEEMTQHPNGIVGLDRIIVFTENPKKTAEHYQAFLRISPDVQVGENQKIVSFSTTPAEIHIVSPPPEDLKQTNDGVGLFAVKFREISENN